MVASKYTSIDQVIHLRHCQHTCFALKLTYIFTKIPSTITSPIVTVANHLFQHLDSSTPTCMPAVAAPLILTMGSGTISTTATPIQTRSNVTGVPCVGLLTTARLAGSMRWISTGAIARKKAATGGSSPKTVSTSTWKMNILRTTATAACAASRI